MKRLDHWSIDDGNATHVAKLVDALVDQLGFFTEDCCPLESLYSRCDDTLSALWTKIVNLPASLSMTIFMKMANSNQLASDKF